MTDKPISAPLQIAVANPKGGCGKTTIAAQLAGFFAANRLATAVVDHDPQRSLGDWLKCRPKKCYPISLLRSATWQQHAIEFDVVIHDLAAGSPLDDLDTFAPHVHKLLIPIMPSPNDIRAGVRFFMDLNRSGLTDAEWEIGLIANRVKGNTNYAKVLKSFVEQLNLPLLGQLRDTQNYIKAMDTGITIFDIYSKRVADDLEHWAPILEWVLQRVDLPLQS
ncbi:MAG: ParA family protein [Cellvibrionaceae bacterium]